ncbi:RimK family alpha-L-glutamate ligase [Streptomyces sp. NPDC059918]|uniref:ATP-grasp domain-containing protein n=1 Tax=unclassified Streptomyces TaxID=2593676 RepID=UPI00364600C9
MSAAARVALATSDPGLAWDTDLPLILDALRARGLDAVAAVWDAPDFDWSRCAAVVIRSTWGYEQHLPQYLAWADAVQEVTRLDNPAWLVRWNTDKRYLGELAGRGVPVVPTRFIAPGEAVALPGHGQFVVKPTVSAGARGAARYTEDLHEKAAGHIAALHAAGSTAMVQPYLTRIDEGERALVFLGGSFSHAVRKGPVLTDIGTVDDDRVPHPGVVRHLPSPAELALAEAALAAVPGSPDLLHARVDIATADDGAPVVMELELVEPNLFMGHSEHGLVRFTDLVRERAR